MWNQKKKKKIRELQQNQIESPTHFNQVRGSARNEEGKSSGKISLNIRATETIGFVQSTCKRRQSNF